MKKTEYIQLITNSCDKKAYFSENSAHYNAQVQREHYGEPRYAYRCRTCPNWHLTRKKPSPSMMKAGKRQAG